MSCATNLICFSVTVYTKVEISLSPPPSCYLHIENMSLYKVSKWEFSVFNIFNSRRGSHSKMFFLMFNFIKKTPAEMFSCELYEMFNNIFFHRTPPVTASVHVLFIPSMKISSRHTSSSVNKVIRPVLKCVYFYDKISRVQKRIKKHWKALKPQSIYCVFSGQDFVNFKHFGFCLG